MSGLSLKNSAPLKYVRDLARSVNHHYGIRGGLDDKPKAPLGTEFRSYGPHVFVAIPIEIYAAHLASSDPDPAVDCDRARHSIVGRWCYITVLIA